jgi:hypothetical protein
MEEDEYLGNGSYNVKIERDFDLWFDPCDFRPAESQFWLTGLV